MKHSLAYAVFVAVALSAVPSSQTVYEPSADDPRIKAVLDARERAADAALRADWKVVEASFAPDVVVNSPANRVITFTDIISRFRSGQIAAEPGTVASRLEFVGVRARFSGGDG